ncbi:MAG: cytochrome c family protein [Pseudomonadota bacterium]
MCKLLPTLIAAIISALIITVGVISFSDVFYGLPKQEKRGYTAEIITPSEPKQNAGGASNAMKTAADDKPVDIAPFIEKADLKLGEQLLKRCQACHSFEKGKPNGVGPNQFGLVGRKVAGVAGYSYSPAMQAKGGNWSEQELSNFITAPNKYVVGTKMAFAGLKKPEERAALIAYIKANFSEK